MDNLRAKACPRARRMPTISQRKPRRAVVMRLHHGSIPIECRDGSFMGDWVMWRDMLLGRIKF
jgi:hypothetical protein